MSYISKFDKNLVCFLAGFHAYIEQELDDPKSSIHAYSRKARCILTYVQGMIDDILVDVDEDQKFLIAKQCANQRLVLTFKEDHRITDELNVVPRDALQDLVNTAFSECFMCPKCGKDARECHLRRTLLRSGAVAHEAPKGVCPFRHGDL